MTLLDYLKKKNLSLQKFSDLTGIGFTTVFRMATGRTQNVTAKNAFIVQKATRGVVKVEDFICERERDKIKSKFSRK